ncbi:MAG: SLBB domain-containing protein [candidate division Zixibacteria bacterium]|nr:SLBB domain-containing protein [candidate division Zixibacteria bacterium]
MKASVSSCLVAVLAVSLLPMGDICAQSAAGADSLHRSWVVAYFDKPIDGELYLIRPGESLEVVFLNTRLGSLNLEVNAEGKIIDRSLGVFDVSGRSLAQVRAMLVEPLRRLYQADDIAVSVGKVYPVSITVTGHVVRPGRYLGYTSQTVRDIIDSAGGIAASGSRRHITFSGGPRTLDVDLEMAEYLGHAEADPYLYAGRLIHVPARSDSTVRLVGEVHDPRVIELSPGDDLTLLVALAGGSRPEGDTGRARLANDPGRDLHAQSALVPGDVIVVPRAANAATGEVAISGAVQSGGRFEYRSGMTLAGLVREAGGTTDKANNRRIAVFRLAEPDAVGNRLPNRYPLLLADDEALSAVLRPGDSIYVPVLVGYVVISGKVGRPGVYPFVSGRTIERYVKMAGGITVPQEEAVFMLTDRVVGTTTETLGAGMVMDGDEIAVGRQESDQ